MLPEAPGNFYFGLIGKGDGSTFVVRFHKVDIDDMGTVDPYERMFQQVVEMLKKTTDHFLRPIGKIDLGEIAVGLEPENILGFYHIKSL